MNNYLLTIGFIMASGSLFASDNTMSLGLKNRVEGFHAKPEYTPAFDTDEDPSVAAYQAAYARSRVSAQVLAQLSEHEEPTVRLTDNLAEAVTEVEHFGEGETPVFTRFFKEAAAAV